jgi:hypothetical protein
MVPLIHSNQFRKTCSVCAGVIRLHRGSTSANTGTHSFVAILESANPMHTHAYQERYGDDPEDSYRRPKPRPVVFAFRGNASETIFASIYTSNTSSLFRLDDECDFAIYDIRHWFKDWYLPLTWRLLLKHVRRVDSRRHRLAA